MRIVLLALMASSIIAVDGGASITPAPGFEPKPAPQPTRTMPGMPPQMPMPGSRVMSFEVEMLTVKAGDASSLAKWAELAAAGFHVVSTVPGDGQTTFCLERPAMAVSGSTLRLPTAVEQEPAVASPLRTRIAATLEERQRSAQPPGRGKP